MLSLREFCTALYLMERFREGRSLPAVLPNSLRFDETFSLATSQPSTAQPSTAYGGPVWQPRPGISWTIYESIVLFSATSVVPVCCSFLLSFNFNIWWCGFSNIYGLGLSPQGVPESQPVIRITSVKQPVQTLTPSQTDVTVQPTEQKKSRVPVLEQNLVDQLSSEEQSALNSKFQEATDADKKVSFSTYVFFFIIVLKVLSWNPEINISHPFFHHCIISYSSLMT